jgi:hypothetical protein
MKKFLFCGCLLIALLTGIYLAPHKDVASAFDRVLPDKLQITDIIAEGNDASLLDVVGFRREFCGVVVFSLTPDTIERMRKEGLTFFADAIQARGFPHQSYYRYEAWKTTPVPQDWFGDGAIAGSLHCANLEPELRNQIQDGSLRLGGFYTTKDEGQLIVLPEERIAIFTYDG